MGRIVYSVIIPTGWVVASPGTPITVLPTPTRMTTRTRTVVHSKRARRYKLSGRTRCYSIIRQETGLQPSRFIVLYAGSCKKRNEVHRMEEMPDLIVQMHDRPKNILIK